MKKFRSPEAALALILLFGAAVRLVFFLQLNATDLVTVPILDSQTYHEWALRLLAGDPGWGETYWMGPLYPHLLALVYLIFGTKIVAVSALQLLLSLVTVGQVFVLTRSLLSDAKKPARAWIPIGAAGIYSLYGAPVFYAGMILMTTLVTSLFLLIAHQALITRRTNTAGSWFRLGLLVGLTALARGNVLLLLVVLPFFLPFKRPSHWKNPAFFYLAALLMLAPVTVRNLIVADDFVLLTSNGGINLLIGQEASHKGIFAPTMDEAQADFDMSMERTLERELGRDLKGSKVSRILTQRAWREFRDNLGAMPLHYLRKAYRFWNGYELPQIYSYDFWHRFFPALRILIVPFCLLSALGLLGIHFLPATGRRIMILLLLTYFFSLLPFFPTSRYRIPITPLLAIGTAVFLWEWWKMKRVQKIRWLMVATVGVVLLLPRWTRLSSEEVLWQVRLHQASRASKRGDLKTTLTMGRLAEEARPGLADTPYQLSVYLDQLKAWPEGVAALQMAAQRAPGNRLIPYQEGLFLGKMGHLDEALSSLERATELDPAWAAPWLRRGLILRSGGKMAEAVRALEQAHELTPGNKQIRSNLASAYASDGRLDEAVSLLKELVADYPNYINGWFNLALVEWKRENPTEAWQALESASRLRNLTSAQKNQIQELRRAFQQ